ncbi:ribosome-inactivating protein PD-L1/PD-L2-like [Chenopodium quinoa]|uniref:ribosome-inactivating protein PD-L1/PD-L2-like n=1 Tax=Chenopodium quinoa TaxID=63459 RepID=UPI000B7894D0|nr:ribosome-inactivating protein PD-L1/PD-L2-like [Chenopodium quinoa]
MPPPPSPPAYHIVELKVSDDVSVKVALNKSNLYVVGYCDQFEGNYRAHFLNDAPLNAINDQFKEAKTPFVSLFTTVLDMKQLKKKLESIEERLGFTPDYKVLNLENNWLAITKAITDSKDGKLSLQLL